MAQGRRDRVIPVNKSEITFQLRVFSHVRRLVTVEACRSTRTFSMPSYFLFWHAISRRE
jgi:hypothetical protein